MTDRVQELEKEIQRLKKINKVLMDRVEHSVDTSGDAFALFEQNILLQKHVEQRTQQLEKAGRRLASLLEQQRKISAQLEESKARFDQLAEQSRTVIWEVDIRGVYTYVSTVVEKVLDYAPKDLVGKKSIHELEPLSFDHGHTRPKILNVIRQGEPFTDLVRAARTKDGRQLWFSTNGIPLYDEKGQVCGYRGSDTDITKRKQAEEALRAGEAKLKDLFENMPNGYYRSTAEGRFVDVNPAFVKMLGYESKEEVLTLDIPHDLYVSPEERTAYDGDEVRVGFLDSSHVQHYRLKTKDGRIIHVEDNARYITDEQGNVRFHEGICKDITERKRAEEERQRLQAQLFQAQKMESIGILAGGVAHDFNNLLQAMSGNVHLLLMNMPDNHPDAERVQSIRRCIDRGAQLVRQLLLFSRKMETKKQAVDINHEVKNAVKMLQRTVPKMISFTLDLDPDDCLVYADPVQVEQVLLNLGGNAADAMPSGGELIISTRLKERLDDSSGHLCEEKLQKPYVRIIVQDTGCGMDQTTQAHIFDPFFTTKETGRGTGLGLASVYGIIKAHDGCIHCSSTLGKGTRFTIFWPAAKAKTADSSQAPAILTQKQIPGGTETVLVVDDESDIRELTAEALARFGYKILTAESGEEAMEVYNKNSSDIDLVVLDLNMPGMGGHECLAGLLKHDPKPLVLVASGYSSRGQIEKSLETGAAGFIAKPFELQTLMDKIREILDHNAGKA